jgi:hypothetical protein
MVRTQNTRLSPDTLLDIHPSAICSRNQYTHHDPGPVIDELRRVAGDRTDILAHVAGTWAGYFDAEHTHILAAALTKIEGAAEWVPLGKRRRSLPPHKNP